MPYTTSSHPEEKAITLMETCGSQNPVSFEDGLSLLKSLKDLAEKHKTIPSSVSMVLSKKIEDFEKGGKHSDYEKTNFLHYQIPFLGNSLKSLYPNLAKDAENLKNKIPLPKEQTFVQKSRQYDR